MCTLNELPPSYIFLPSSHDIQGRPEGMDIPLQLWVFFRIWVVSMEGFLRVSHIPVVTCPTEFELCI